MRRVGIFALLLPSIAAAQSGPNWQEGHNVGVAEWQTLWTSKADYAGLVAEIARAQAAELAALPRAGGVLTGPLTLPSGNSAPAMNAPSNTAGAFYTDKPVSGVYPSVVRLGDRATIGCANATPLVQSPGPTQLTWAGKTPYNNGYGERDAALIVCSTGAGPGIVSLSRTSDSKQTVQISSYGAFLQAVADATNSVAEGAYLEAHTSTDTTTTANVMELQSVQRHAGAYVPNPGFVNPGGGAFGALFGAGGPSTAAGTTYDSQTAISINTLTKRWQVGINFGLLGLTRAGGTSNGIANAIELGNAHQIGWYFDSSGTPSFTIRSDDLNATTAMSLVKNSTGLVATGTGGSVTMTTAGGLSATGTVNGNMVTGNSAIFTNLAAYGQATLAAGIVSGVVTMTYASSMVPDLAAASMFRTTLTGNTTLGCPNNLHTGTLRMQFTQDATGGRTIIWPACFKWPGGTAGVLSTAANARDELVGDSFDGTTVNVTLTKAYQ